jgi:hypothetical protein
MSRGFVVPFHQRGAENLVRCHHSGTNAADRLFTAIFFPAPNEAITTNRRQPAHFGHKEIVPA